jgi:UDP-N-acetylglucosamine--N-acetylmuramyl-(pentapeptide) pyrophosphoryl-undecaprenol N-acetylglucosamine transferase
MGNEQELQCLIAAGGTAGHVLPALAIADALVERGVFVTFAGSPEAIEGQLVPAAGYELDTLRSAGFPRRLGWPLVKALGIALRAPWSAGRIIRNRKPDMVLGGGGYTAGPAILAARVLRVPAALTEADAHLGLANRLAAPLVKRAFLSYPIEGRTGQKYRVVGRPLPSRSRANVERDAARAKFDLPPDGIVVLIAGGSQGARALNEAAVAAFATEGPAVLHLCGQRDYDGLRDRVERPDYRLIAFTHEFGSALAAADLVVSRSGGAVWEIAAAAKPAILIPFRHATADHQLKNAAYFAAGGAARLMPEVGLDLGPAVAELLADRDTMKAMAGAMERLARPDAADVIADELIALTLTRAER